VSNHFLEAVISRKGLILWLVQFRLGSENGLEYWNGLNYCIRGEIAPLEHTTRVDPD